MRPRSKLRLAALFALVTSVLAPVPFADAVPAPPNVLIVLTDDQGLRTMRVALRSGARSDVMPNVLRRIVSSGVSFQNAYVSNALCCPSRATILTGLYSKNNGVYTNTEPLGGAPAYFAEGDAAKAMPAVLQAQGYTTGLFGKFLNQFAEVDGFGPVGSAVGPDVWAEGWDHFDGFYQQNGAYYDYERITYDRASDPDATTSVASGYSTRVFGRSLVDWLQTLDGSKPFFAYYAPYAPHAGSGIGGPYDDLFEGARPFRSPAIGEDTSDKPSYLRGHPLSDEKLAGQHDLRVRQLQALWGVDVQVGNILDELRVQRAVEQHDRAPHVGQRRDVG